MELPVSDVDRDDARGTGLEEAVREASRRRADVGAVASRDVDVQRVERVLELLATARDEARRSLDFQHDVVRDLLTRLVVTADEPGEHERLCLRARLRQSALDEHHVESLLRHEARLDDELSSTATRRAPISREP